MERRHFLVTYDISDDKRRNAVFQACYDFGNHVQYSVFLCELDARELVRLCGRLSSSIHNREDQILILDLGKAIHPLDSIVQCIGRGMTVPARALVV